MSQETSRRAAWTPPARPDWVERVNAEGRHLDIAGVVPLDADSLIRTAIANTGLDHFGEDDWREPFERYVTALDREAELSLVGRMMTRTDLLMLLEARLRIEDAYRRHPEIEDEQIEAPLWIFGLGRSGTTMLQRLLGLDPENRTPRQYETLFPVAWQGEGQDTRLELAHQRVSMWERVTPEIARIHEFGGDADAESVMIEALSFRQPAWLNLFGMVPSYNAWIAGQPYEKSFEYARRGLKLLQWQQPGRRWILKSPDSIHYLPQLFKVFPDVRLVWAHRDPVKTLSSAVSLVGTLNWIRSDRRFPDGVFEGIVHPPAVAAALDRPIDWLESGVIPQSSLCSVQYAELIEDPLAVVRQIYDFYGLEFGAAGRAAIEQHVASNPREARSVHRYSTGTDDEVRAERQVFDRYQKRFAVPFEF